MTITAGLRKTLYVVVLLLIAAVFLTPYIFSIFAAFKPLSEIQADRAWQLPSHFTWDNFVTIFTQYHFATYLANTVAVTVTLEFAAPIHGVRDERAGKSLPDGTRFELTWTMNQAVVLSFTSSTGSSPNP